jgi:DNA modification methylase
VPAPSPIPTVQVDPRSLRGADYNPRILPEHEGRNLIRSMERFGFLENIVVNQRSGWGEPTIISGHMRVQAAMRAGLELVDVKYIDVDGATERELNLHFNRTRGIWDDDKLAELIYELQELPDVDMSLTGFTDVEISKLLDSVAGLQALPDDDTQESQPRVAMRVRPGDLWVLGEHQLRCGDCRNLHDMEGLMGADLARLVYTDPPYGVDYDGGSKLREQLIGDDDANAYQDFLPILGGFCHPKAPMYLYTSDVLAHDVYVALLDNQWTIRTYLIWLKNTAQFGNINASYKAKHEALWYCHQKSQSPFWYGPNNETTVWEADRSSRNDYHPTQKPVELAERAMRNSSLRGDIVLDCFGGGGSTLLAAEHLGRRCRMMELVPAYCDVILARWERETSKKAIRRED